ncbi:ABC-type branched-chain amino acid transport system protein [Bifidobacterium saguini DSM 23967]|uniref:ABC-type branched-chain amino acid transport system protein n=1 Tax=Bifidobacterium saguini DSM 23967 TaxID=1437607 RepID=A0A087DCD8_9BIFI|nr:DUF2637 domain-containing protein [Bifidobacterium saguini]KFI93188.1 ABC-type branched-chain amino acid transport system protein [Bifidobacterium saguini DSM 23967]
MNKQNKTRTTGSVSMLPGVTVGVMIAIIAFVLSFDALRLVFVASGINPMLSWGGPLCVDGTILLCTWATWGFRKGHIRGRWYPWAGLVMFSLFSVTGNALHAWLNAGGRLPMWGAPAIMSIPPIALLYSTHLIVIIAGDRQDKITRAINDMTDTDADPEPSIVKNTTTEPEKPFKSVEEEKRTVSSGSLTAENEPDVVDDLFARFEPMANTPHDVEDRPFDQERHQTSEPLIQPQPRIMARIPEPEPEHETVQSETSTEPKPETEATSIPVQPSGKPVRKNTKRENSARETETRDAAAAGEGSGNPSGDAGPKAPDAPELGFDPEPWRQWARDMKQQGLPVTATTAHENGPATSLRTAKRRLADLRKVWPDEF